MYCVAHFITSIWQGSKGFQMQFIYNFFVGSIGLPADRDIHIIISFSSPDVCYLGPVVQKPINANPRLKVNQGVYFYTLRCCSTLILGKILH